MDFQYLFFAIFITMDCATSLRRFFTFQNFHSMSFNWHRTVAKRYVSTKWIKKHIHLENKSWINLNIILITLYVS